MREVFKSIKNYEGMYEVSDLGRVKSFHKPEGTILKTPIDVGGYKLVNLSIEGNSKTFKVHQLVAMAFLNHTPCGHKVVVNHIDLDKTNNNVDNLETVTTRENSNQKHLKSASKYTGVVMVNNYTMFKAQIRINGDVISLGHYVNELDASDAYQIALMHTGKYVGDKKIFRAMIKEIKNN